MKKHMKALAILTSILLLSVLFAGCDVIDDMRASQAYYTDSGIRYNGKTYLLMADQSGLFAPELDRESTVYVTEADVPVLLSSILGTQYSVSKDGIFLVLDYGAFQMDSIYCMAEKYDAVMEELKKGFIHAGYQYSLYDWWNETEITYYFTEQENNAVEAVLALESEAISGPVSYSFDVYIDLIAYSENGFFFRNDYCLCQYEDEFYLLEYENGEPSFIYKASAEQTAAFSGIVDRYLADNDAIENNLT